MKAGLAISVLIGCALHVAAGSSSAQSLADIARKEAERRDTAPTPSKVYTNDSLIPDFTTPPATPAPTEATGDSDAGLDEAADAAQASPEADVAGEIPAKNERGEDYWRGRATRIRTRLDSQRAKIEVLQQRLDSMAEPEDSTAARERELTRRTLAQARSDLTHLEQEWANFEAGARAKNVPDAWIR